MGALISPPLHLGQFAVISSLPIVALAPSAQCTFYAKQECLCKRQSYDLVLDHSAIACQIGRRKVIFAYLGFRFRDRWAEASAGCDSIGWNLTCLW